MPRRISTVTVDPESARDRHRADSKWHFPAAWLSGEPPSLDGDLVPARQGDHPRVEGDCRTGIAESPDAGI